MAVVNLNNELKELSIKEQDEIAVILATLSAKAGEYIPAIETDYQILTELDFIFAKAAYALEYNGITPQTPIPTSITAEELEIPEINVIPDVAKKELLRKAIS